MKTIKILFASLLACLFTFSLQAQSGKETINDHTKTATIKVTGQCGMCEKRIEKAALSVQGVTAANWNEDNKTLIIKYNQFKKDIPDQVQKSVAAAGHDTEKYKASEAAYQGLPDCCHYNRKP